MNRPGEERLEQGQDPAGCKVSKKRMTVLLVANMDGHLEPMVVINKSLRPRSFKRIGNDPTKLPSYIQCRANSRAWMDSLIFKEWIVAFDEKLQKENRKGLLFLDKFSCHVLGVETASQSKNLQG